MRSWFDNPIFHRALQVERRKIGSGPKAWMRRCGVAVLLWLIPLGILLVFNLEQLFRAPSSIGWITGLSLGISSVFMLLHVISKATHGTLNGICLEKEQKTYESLQSTLLNPREIVGGKLLTGLWPTLRDLAVTLPGVLLLSLVSHQTTMVLGSYSVMLFTAVVLGCVGLVCSYKAQSTHAATQQSTLWVSCLLFAGPLLAALVKRGAPCLFSPFGAYAGLMSPDFKDACWHLNPLPYLVFCGALLAGLWEYLVVLERQARRVK